MMMTNEKSIMCYDSDVVGLIESSTNMMCLYSNIIYLFKYVSIYLIFFIANNCNG